MDVILAMRDIVKRGEEEKNDIFPPPCCGPCRLKKEEEYITRIENHNIECYDGA